MPHRFIVDDSLPYHEFELGEVRTRSESVQGENNDVLRRRFCVVVEDKLLGLRGHCAEVLEEIQVDVEDVHAEQRDRREKLKQGVSDERPPAHLVERSACHQGASRVRLL